MGYRNPVTSATAVDTGRNAPGVRIYASGTNPASGVVEWSAGGAGPARATFTSSDTGSGGSAFTLDPGQDNGVQAATLALNVEGKGTGGYQSVGRLTGDVFYLNEKQLATVGGDWTVDLQNATYSWPVPTAWTTAPGCSQTVTVPTGQQLDIEWKTPRVNVGASSDLQLRLLVNGGPYETQEFATGTGGALYSPARLTASVAGFGGPITFQLQAICPAGAASIQTAAGGYLWFQHRIR